MLRKVLIALGLAATTSMGIIGGATAQSSVFCSDDAAALLGDVCVDSQGNVPDNADIRSVITQSCQPDNQGVVNANAAETVQASFNAMWDEYHFCSRQSLSNGQSVYYLRMNFDNSVIYRYSTQDESWGRLNVFSYSAQTGQLNGQLITLTRNGRELPTSESVKVNISSMYSALSDLLALQNISPRVARELMP